MRNRFADKKTQSSVMERVACAILFLLFAFFWLYAFQADVMAVAQHGLSGGRTHYDRTVGAVIISGVLIALQLLVYALTRLQRHCHVLTYVPSFLLLAFVSSISHPFRWGAWPLAAVVVMALWGGAVWLARRSSTLLIGQQRAPGIFSRSMWVNMLGMGVMMLAVAAVSNTNAVQHFKAHDEVAFMRGDSHEVLRTGQRSHESDASLTMLRALALSQNGLLADALFTYAVSGSGDDLLPLDGSQSTLMLMPDTLLYDHFGLRPDSLRARMDSAARALPLTTRRYLDSLQRDTNATAAWRDYRLMGLLIDRRLDDFASLLPRHYALSADSLPRHYREALVLYQQTTDTLFIYSDTLMLRRYRDYRSNDTLYRHPDERLLRTIEDYGDTYWHYYDEQQY